MIHLILLLLLHFLLLWSLPHTRGGRLSRVWLDHIELELNIMVEMFEAHIVVFEADEGRPRNSLYDEKSEAPFA